MIMGKLIYYKDFSGLYNSAIFIHQLININTTIKFFFF